MATYLILNGTMLLVVGLLAIFFRKHYSWKNLIFSLVVLLALTAVFDSLIILNNIVAYDSSLISGARVIAAPIEDFAYSLVAVLLAPILWKVVGRD